MIGAVRNDSHWTHGSPRLQGNDLILVKVIDDGFITKSCALKRSRVGSTADHGRRMWLSSGVSVGEGLLGLSKYRREV
jgi:hypothetical protein